MITMAVLLPISVSCSTIQPSPQIAPNFNDQVAQVIKEIGTIKPGMERTELTRILATEGGISTPNRRTFVHKDCSYIKVDVEFQTVDKTDIPEEDPRDKVLRISKPYLGWNVID